MESVIIKDKKFEVSITASTISQRVKELGAKLNEDLKNTRPIFVSVLNGSFLFAADLFREIKMDAEIERIEVEIVLRFETRTGIGYLFVLFSEL